MNVVRPRWILPGLASILAPALSRTQRSRVVFSSFHGRGYRGNARALFEYLVANPGGLEPIWLTTCSKTAARVRLLSGSRSVYQTHSRDGLEALASAGACLFTHGTSDFPYVRLNPDAIKFNLYHGLPTKRGEYLRPSGKRATNLLHRSILKYRFGSTDYFLSSSRAVSEVFSARFGLEFNQFVEAGYPAYDRLVRGEGRTVSEIWPDAPPHTRVVLYAPTFRRKTATRWFPFADRDLAEVARMLESMDAVCCLRPHPNETLAFAPYRDAGDRFVLADQHSVEDIHELLPNCGLVITDYSSIYLEGLLCGASCMFVPYDRDEYERGHAFDYEAVTPGPKVRSQQEFLQSVHRLSTDATYFENERMSVRSRFFNRIDDGATERVARFLQQTLLT
jgi:CDP-glycerol glycerophosphotransferase